MVIRRDYITQILEGIKPSNKSTDRAGVTPLIQLSYTYRKANKERKAKIRKAVYVVGDRINSLSTAEVSNLIGFIDMSKMGRKVANEYKIILDNLPASSKNVPKQAEILRFVSEHHRPKLDPTYVNNYQEVKATKPWHWIDAMADVYPRAAYAEVLTHQRDRDFKERLMDRIPSWRSQPFLKKLEALFV